MIVCYHSDYLYLWLQQSILKPSSGIIDHLVYSLSIKQSNMPMWSLNITHLCDKAGQYIIISVKENHYNSDNPLSKASGAGTYIPILAMVYYLADHFLSHILRVVRSLWTRRRTSDCLILGGYFWFYPFQSVNIRRWKAVIWVNVSLKDIVSIYCLTSITVLVSRTYPTR